MTTEPLVAALLELDAELRGSIPLYIGGGLGLYLKQVYLENHPEIRTLFPLDRMPLARTTQDIDVFLRAEIVTDPERVRPLRDALDHLGYTVVDSAKFMQFVKPWPPGTVKIDLLAGPLGPFSNRVPSDDRRIKPQPSINLHARKVEAAIGIEENPFEISMSGMLPTKSIHETVVLVPQAFTFVLMKLMAFHDRVQDQNKELGRHHALDLYRIIGLLTKDEEQHALSLAAQHATNPVVIDARELAEQYFIANNGIGRLRIREHKLFREEFDLDRFALELRRLLHGT